MIRKLRIRFIVVAAFSVLIVCTLSMCMVNFVNYHEILHDADSALEILHSLAGRLPELAEEFNWESAGPRYRSPEMQYEIRFFSVLLNGEGKIVSSETDRIFLIDEQNAMAYASSAMEQQKASGFVEDYRYMRKAEGSHMRLVFLDCGRMLAGYRQMTLSSIWITLFIVIGATLLITILSSRVSRPAAQSYEKQKRFITDAGHELKTPITIIQTDAELLSMEIGSSEWLKDIQEQTSRLSSLTNDLIYLARMEEDQHLPMIVFPLSDVVEETLSSFEVAAKARGKTICQRIQPSVEYLGNEKALRQLASILIDNAVKYAPAGSTIEAALTETARHVRLSVKNQAPDLTQEQIMNLFERFYRADGGRNSKESGHGIGLSVAKAIVSAHNGKIDASKMNDDLVFTVLLPQVRR